MVFNKNHFYSNYSLGLNIAEDLYSIDLYDKYLIELFDRNWLKIEKLYKK